MTPVQNLEQAAEKLREMANEIRAEGHDEWYWEDSCIATNGLGDYHGGISWPNTADWAADLIAELLERLAGAEKDASRYQCLKILDPVMICAITFRFREACAVQNWFSDPDACVDAVIDSLKKKT